MSQSARLADYASSSQSVEPEVTQATGPTAILLTSLPMQTLQQELHYITLARPRIDRIYNLIVWLFGDPHKAALETTYISFQHAFRTFSRAFICVLTRAELFYNLRFHAPSLSLQESVSQLLDPKSQRPALHFARKAVSECEEAYRILDDEVLPLLVQPSNQLKTWADARIQWDRRLRERSSIGVPNLLLDLVFESIPPVHWSFPEIKECLEDFAESRRTLERLPSSVQNLRGHFLRLLEVGRDGIDKLGYTTVADIERLVEDRALCLHYVRIMVKDWHTERVYLRKTPLSHS